MIKKILAACQDTGPANNISPVLELLQSGGCQVVLFARGPATAVFDKLGISYLPYTGWASVQKEGLFDLAYLAVDSSPDPIGYEIARTLVAAGVDCPLCLQEDFWGSGLAQRDKWSGLTPTRFYVNDKRGAELGKLTFPLMDQTGIITSGWPHLDAYKKSGEEINQIGLDTRASLGIAPGLPVIFFSGQLERTGETLVELVESIPEIGEEVCLITRMHPRMSEKYAEEAGRCQGAIDRFKEWGKGQHFDCTGPNYTIPDLIAASTLVASMFSTTLIEAAAWQKQCLAILYPEVGLAEWLRVTGEGVMPDFPLCELGACAKAANRGEIREALRDSYAMGLEQKLKPQQQKNINSDGRNAERVARDILALLG